MLSKQQASPTPGHLPLEPLLVLLRRKGFVVKPDDYVEMLKVIELYGTRDLDDMAAFLCPLVATNPQEQANFYKAVEEYKHQQSASEETMVAIAEPDDDKGFRITWWMIALAMAALALFIWKPWVKPIPESANIREVNTVYRLGDTLKLLPPVLADSNASADIQVAWMAGSDSLLPVEDSFLVLREDGPNQLVQHISSLSEKTPVAASSDTAFFFVCSEIPDFTLGSSATRISIQDTVAINITFHDATDSLTPTLWTIDGKSWDAAAAGYRYRFETTGAHLVSCQAIVESATSPCSPTSAITINVYDPQADFTLTALNAGSDIAPPHPVMHSWLHWLLLAPALLAFGFTLLRPKPKQKADEATETTTTDEKPAIALKPPFDIPMADYSQRDVLPERSLRVMLTHMKQRSESGELALNIPQSVRHIIRNAGLPELIFSPVAAHREFLVLIDRSNPKSMVTSLFDWLAQWLEAENIPITRFYYNNDLVCFNNQYPLGLSINKLSDQYSDHTLLFLGSGHQLVYRPYPIIDPLLADTLKRWERRAIITPRCHEDWGEKEKALAASFTLLPADPEALEQFVPLLSEKSAVAKRFLLAFQHQWYSLEDFDFEDIQELKNFLGDPTLYQWLCSICVFPKLRWELLIAIGKAVLGANHADEKLTYENLLRLCRIPWMAQGVFPQKTRLELLKELELNNELVARNTLLDMLQQAKKLYTDNYFFGDELDLQQTTNEFVLFATDAEKFAGFKPSHDKFKKYWATDLVLDAPVRQYFGNTGNKHWDTPIKANNQTIGLDAYFAIDQQAFLRKRKMQNRLLRAASMLLAALWALIFFHAVPPNMAVAQKLYAADSSENRSLFLSIKYNNDCQLQNAVVSLLTPDSSFVLQQDDQFIAGTDSVSNNDYMPNTLTGTITAPYSILAAGAKSIEISWNGRSAVHSFDYLPDSLSLSLVCGEPPPPPTFPPYLEEIWSGPGGLLSIDLQGKRTYGTVAAETSPDIFEIGNSIRKQDSSWIMLRQPYGSNATDRQWYRTSLPGISPNAVTLVFCDRGYATAQQAMQDSSRCGTAQTLNLYYPKLQNRILVPRNGVDYVAGELDKINSIATAAAKKSARVSPNNPGNASIVDATVYTNKFFYRDEKAAQRHAAVVAGFPQGSTIGRLAWHKADFEGTAFDRDYIIMTIREQVKPLIAKNDPPPANQRNTAAAKTTTSRPTSTRTTTSNTGNTNTAKSKVPEKSTNTEDAIKPDCNRVFRTIRETYQVSPKAVCRVDLSNQKLSKLPPELLWFPNMLELNLSGNSIKDSELDYLRKKIPGCKIILDGATNEYVQQTAQQTLPQQTASPAKTPENVIYIYENASVTTAIDKSFEELLGLALQRIKGSRQLILTAYYADDKGKKTAQQIINRVNKRMAALTKGTSITVSTNIEQLDGLTTVYQVVVGGTGFTNAELESMDLRKQAKAAY